LSAFGNPLRGPGSSKGGEEERGGRKDTKRAREERTRRERGIRARVK